jgi:hypothetical protein
MAQIYSANLWSEIPPNGSTPHYIETTARLADNGLMVAQTKTADHNWFGQFCGTAVVALVDASGNQIYPTDPQTFCVSGTLGGNCERTDTWNWRFGPDQVASARGLAIYHTGNADLFGGLWHFIESVWEFIQYLISSEQGQGTTGQPDSSVPDEQPWNAYSDFGAGGDAVAVRDPRGRMISLASPFGTSSLGVPPIGGGGAQPAVGARAGGNTGAIGEELRPRG